MMNIKRIFLIAFITIAYASLTGCASVEGRQALADFMNGLGQTLQDADEHQRQLELERARNTRQPTTTECWDYGYRITCTTQ